MGNVVVVAEGEDRVGSVVGGCTVEDALRVLHRCEWGGVDDVDERLARVLAVVGGHSERGGEGGICGLATTASIERVGLGTSA